MQNSGTNYYVNYQDEDAKCFARKAERARRRRHDAVVDKAKKTTVIITVLFMMAFCLIVFTGNNSADVWNHLFWWAFLGSPCFVVSLFLYDEAKSGMYDDGGLFS